MTLDLKDRLYTSSEVAEILGVSLRSVYRYLEEGKLDADIKTATGRHRFSKKNILDFLQPGGITKEQITEGSLNDSEDDDFDFLDLPAINKTKKVNETLPNNDDFSFDLDEDFFKSLDFDSGLSDKAIKEQNVSSNTSKNVGGEFIDDDLERLLKEFEEKEGLLDSDEEDFLSSSLSKNEIPTNNSYESIDSSKKFENKDDDFDFDLEDFFKELEEDSSKPLANTKAKENNEFNIPKFSEDSFERETTGTRASNSNNSQDVNRVTQSFEEEEDLEDNWLERFRKAAQKNIASEPVKPSEDKLKSSFFDSSNLENFFEDRGKGNQESSISKVSSIGFDKETSDTKLPVTELRFYSSTLNGLKEIAQNVDKIARKFDTDYAFTMNAGLSLHKPIAPFSVIHAYVRERDLELFEDYLNLNEVFDSSKASVCLMTTTDLSVFEDAYELHGLYVVSNVQLRSDLIDNGLDKLAREI